MNNETYSRDLQDLFVSGITNNKTNGTYVEIGSAHPIIGNNTYLLEKNLSWTGISVEISKDLCEIFKSIRKNKVICDNALNIDYEKIFVENNLPENIDYLQVDCEPALTTFGVLKKIPKNYKFSIITFEHDFYNYNENNENFIVRKQSREYLASLGYVLIADDLSCKGIENKPFEDWWIYPELIDANMIKKFIEVNGVSKEVGKYLSKRGLV